MLFRATSYYSKTQLESKAITRIVFNVLPTTSAHRVSKAILQRDPVRCHKCIPEPFINLSIMEVTSENFEVALTAFESALEQSDFVAMDLEFTGIKGRPEVYADSPENRFANLREVAVRFKIIQVGICLFRNRPDNELECFPFNFYVFPEDFGNNRTNIMLEASAMQFLKDHNMDFNKWIYKGIPYLNENQDKQQYDKCYTVHSLSEEGLHLNPGQAEVVERAVSGIEEWIVGDKSAPHDVRGLNSYLRRYMYSELKQKYPFLVTETIKINKIDATIRLHYTDPHGDISERISNEKSSAYRKQLGFRRVFILLVERKLPLLVHNGLTDLLFFMQAFHGELPRVYQEFKVAVNQLFPVIYDTRYMLLNLPGLLEALDKAEVTGRGLEQFYKFLVSGFNPITFPQGFERYSSSQSYAHEAGYDALMTGVCFKALEIRGFSMCEYANRIPLFRSFFDICLDREDISNCDEFLYVSGENVKKHFAGNSDYQSRFVRETEYFVKCLSSSSLEKLEGMQAEANWTVIPAERYFANKKAKTS